MRGFTALLILVALAVQGCETIVEVDPPPHDAQIVAHGFFGADSLWVAQVTRSVPHTARQDPEAVLDAQVEVWTDGLRVATLAPADSGLYTAHGFSPDTSTAYTLRVSVPDHDPVEGTDRLPPGPFVAAFQDTTTTSAHGSRTVTMRLEIDDPKGEDNYYGLFVVQGAARVDPTAGSVQPIPPSLHSFESDDPVLESVLADYLDTDMRQYRTAFFNDKSFDGSRKAVDLAISYRPPDPADEVQTLRTYAVVLLAVSEHLYRYWTSADRQLAGNENPFAEPIRVHSNMSNELGVFAGFGYRTLPISPADEDVASACERLQISGSDCDQILSMLPGRLRDIFFRGLLTH